MVECLQNLSKHAEEHTSSDGAFSGNGIFIVGRLGNDNQDYQILTGNAVETTKVADLKALLEKINQLDKDGLKDFLKSKCGRVRFLKKGEQG
jgi:hypothetical protein